MLLFALRLELFGQYLNVTVLPGCLPSPYNRLNTI